MRAACRGDCTIWAYGLPPLDRYRTSVLHTSSKGIPPAIHLRQGCKCRQPLLPATWPCQLHSATGLLAALPVCASQEAHTQDKLYNITSAAHRPLTTCALLHFLPSIVLQAVSGAPQQQPCSWPFITALHSLGTSGRPIATNKPTHHKRAWSSIAN